MEKAKAAGIGEKRAKGFLDELAQAGKIHEHQEKRSGTNPLKLIARYPQNQPTETTDTPELQTDANQSFLRLRQRLRHCFSLCLSLTAGDQERHTRALYL